MTRQVALAAIGSFLVTVTIVSLWSSGKPTPPAPIQPPAPAPRAVQLANEKPHMLVHPVRFDRPVLVESMRPAKAEFKKIPGAYVIDIDAGTP